MHWAKTFLQPDTRPGMLMLLAAILALLAANSPLSPLYDAIKGTPVSIKIGAFVIDKPLLLWINDGLMAIFFFLIGLEVKREVLEGELSSPDQIILPGLGAIGGISAPAIVYSLLNWDIPVAMSGWAVASATDIAFALGILSLFGKRVPPALKVFLLTLAIFDDLAAIAIIAVFYAGDLSLSMLGLAAVILVCGVAANLLGVRRTSVYLLIGIALWVTVLQSGVHATLAGVLIALCVPLREEGGHSPLKSVEADLHTPVAYFILPLFAFANAGLALGGMGLQDLTSPVALGIVGGLVLGNPIGILLLTGAGVALGLTKLPPGVNWLQMAGVSFICGVGFTMSLFIAGLAFEHGSGDYFSGDRLGVMAGSLLSAMAAYVILCLSLPKTAAGSQKT